MILNHAIFSLQVVIEDSCEPPRLQIHVLSLLGFCSKSQSKLFKMPSNPLLLVLSLVGLLAGSTNGETVLGAVVFTRHGDRTTKHYGAQALTNLGASQCFQSGSDYRARYIAAGSPHRIQGISEFKYDSTQVYATAPNQGILLNTATSFLQGLYPPLMELNPDVASQTLNDGSESTSPLNGYQYVSLMGTSSNSPDTIWIKGDDACPAYTTASDSFLSSTEYQTTLDSTRDFYQSLFPLLQSVPDISSASSLSYAKAFDIYDLLNVAAIHNASQTQPSPEQLFQLRTLADSAEFHLNYNTTQPARSIHASTLAGAILSQLNKTVSSAGKKGPKFSLFAGSYDTMVAFFGLTNLTSASPDFYGLPGYASTMAFELYTSLSVDSSSTFPDEQDLNVRFLFRNGTEGELQSFPLFGTGSQERESLSWGEFKEGIRQRAITTVEKWCGACESDADFCKAYAVDSQVESKRNGGGVSNAVAGVIGAMVTLGVVAVVGAVVFMVMRRRRQAGTNTATKDKGSLRSLSSV